MATNYVRTLLLPLAVIVGLMLATGCTKEQPTVLPEITSETPEVTNKLPEITEKLPVIIGDIPETTNEPNQTSDTENVQLSPLSELPGQDYFAVKTNDDFQFAFHFYEDEPIFEFISPSNVKYAEGSEGLTVKRATQVSGLKSVYFLFDSGEIGDWVICYDKLSNEDIEMYYAE